MLSAIRLAHTLIWFVVEAAVVHLLWTGLTRRRGRAVAVSAALVVGETAVFVVNGFRCPLTDLAEAAGAEHGSVTDTYLPGWLAHNLPAIHTPLGMLLLWLHRESIGDAVARLGAGQWSRRRASARRASSNRSRSGSE
ncbi:MAG: hypothetical protein AB1Z55_06250 [Acidimicrobiia bacterium]